MMLTWSGTDDLLKPLLGLCIGLGLLLSAMTAMAAEGERRVALVVGIATYSNAPPLLNPTRDARALAETLGRLGFDVDLQLDLDNRALAGALRSFGLRAADADVALVYFAGHGVQVDGTNYLIPADAKLERVRDLLYEAIPLQLFLGEISQARKIGIMLLDACRDNPFVDRLSESMGAARTSSIGQGLSRIDDTPSGTMVAMATRANVVAEDGTGDHSPYAQALLTELQVPGLELGLFFRRVRDQVLEMTQGRQEPYTFGSVAATPFYFNPKPPNRAPVVATAAPLTVLDNAGSVDLAIPAPSDPDNDHLVVQVTGLPRGGAVLVGDRPVLIGDYLTVEQLRSAAFRPDGSAIGAVGTFAYVVSDGQGASTRGGMALLVDPSNHAPQAAAEVSAVAVVNRLSVPMPTDADGDPLTIRVRRVPDSGTVRVDGEPISPGDRLEPAQLAKLTYDTGTAAVDTTEQLVLSVDDGRGGEATIKVAIRVAATGEAPPPVASSPGPAPVAVAAAAPNPPASPAPSSAVTAPAEPASATSAPAEPVSDAPVLPAQPSVTLKPESGTFIALMDANLRAEPDSAAARVSRVAKGTQLTLLARVADSKWLYVAPPEGAPAFIFGDLLGPLPAAKPAAESPATAAPEQPVETTTALLSATEPKAVARTQGNGNSFQDCPECPILVRVPSGSFTMGSSSDPNARPPHRVTIAKPFALGKYEVTVAEWRACVQGGGCAAMPEMQEPADMSPVHNVHWLEAVAYVDWLQKRTGQRYRLPSEAEWEYAARAGTSGRFWWGDRIDGTKVACKDCGGTLFERQRPPNVNAQPANGFGLSGMSGGVAEWLADCWFKDYAAAPADGSARTQPSCRQHVLRGGSWRDQPEDLEVTTRNFYDNDVRYPGNGLRVARDLD